jgi:protein-S-isoprenylcysteine O-methyltransferase Ste14
MLAKSLLVLAASLTFVRILRSRRHFDDARVPPTMAVLGLLSISTFLIVSYLAILSATPLTALPATVGVAISYYLFDRSLSALDGRKLKIAFDPLLPGDVIKSGIYSRIRHPMYTAYILFWASYALGSGDWRSVPPALLLTSIYVFLALSEEKRILASSNRETYLALMSRTGMFWPRLW